MKTVGLRRYPELHNLVAPGTDAGWHLSTQLIPGGCLPVNSTAAFLLLTVL